MNRKISWRTWGKRLGKLVLIALPLLLLWWSYKQVPFALIWEALQQLSTLQLIIWLFVNLVLVMMITGRWWLILVTLGNRLPFLALVRYRLASFAISYFTPGPQFGGEPVQVLALQQRHAIPGTTGTASVGLDRLLELIANFSFLVFGIAIALSGTWLPSQWRNTGLIFALGLLALPLAYLILMLTGKQPLNSLIKILPIKIARNWVSSALGKVENEMSAFCVEHPAAVLMITLLSLSVWVGMVFEYWLLGQFFGLQLSLAQAVSALTSARLAILTPLPGGLGALEASQVLAFQMLGFEPAFGISISLLIRLRDLLFGVIGLLGAASIFGWHYNFFPKIKKMDDRLQIMKKLRKG
ncbi:MAG: lysylphosphatidylglycerol synthase transmembrane domain-containing protein [Anaerolineales bacterium]